MPAVTSSPKKPLRQASTTAAAPVDDGLRNLSKLAPPTLHRVYSNRRLVERLDLALRKPIVWVQGPPGAGKTTLIASYLAARGADPLWYRLDQGDADPATLLLYLAAARGAGGRPLPPLTAEFKAALPLFARRFFGELLACPHSATVVFDDYHEIALDCAIHAAFAAGLEEVPTGRNVIVISRAAPPPQFARLRVNGLVDLVEPGALLMTVEETEGLVRERSAPADRAAVERIVRQTQGWAAGVILMLEAGAEMEAGAVSVAAAGTTVPGLLFDYFAGEVLQRLAPRVQRVLCALSLMPTTTVASAVRLTGEADAGDILEDLRRRNYFTVRDAAAEPHYRFHPLFREFLLAQTHDLLPAGERDALTAQAAALLDAEGQTDAAVALLAEAGATTALASLVKRRASSLVDEHRIDTLIGWLGRLPEALLREDAWLSYWFGTAHAHSDATRSLQGFARAFTLFEAVGDVPGQFLAWAGQAEAVWADAFGSMARFDALIVALRALVARHPDFPSPEVALKVSSLMSTALTRRGNDRTEIEAWQRRALTAAEQASSPGQFEALGFMFAINDIQDANFAAARASLSELPDPWMLDHLPLIQTPSLIAHMMLMVYRPDRHDIPGYAEEAIRRIENAANYRWVPIIAGFVVSDACRRLDLKTAAEWHRRMGVYADRVAPKRGAQYHYLAAQLYLLKDELAEARRHANMGVESAVRTGWYFFEGYSRLARADVLIGAADFAAAATELESLDDVLSKSALRILEFPAALLRAELQLALDGGKAGLAALSTAGARPPPPARGRFVAPPPRAPRLCALALGARIESAFVRRLIRASELPPPADADETWPWQIRITTFGEFRVDVDDAPLAFSRKTPKRLITLLKAIIAHGGSTVPEEKLIDAVWPDEEGDAGHRALTIAIHRLRKLLGDAGSVTMRAGRVGLDPGSCWLDVWSFERLLARQEPNETRESYDARIRRGLGLYRGEFLAGDDDLWWTIAPREAMREASARGRHGIG